MVRHLTFVFEANPKSLFFDPKMRIILDQLIVTMMMVKIILVASSSNESVMSPAPPITTTMNATCGDDETKFDEGCCEEAEKNLATLSQKVIEDGKADGVTKGNFEWTEEDGCVLEFPHHAPAPFVATLSREECAKFETCQWSRDAGKCRCYQYELDQQEYSGLILYGKPGKGRMPPRGK